MRTKYALKNMSTVFISHFMSILLGFITQRIFVKYLGVEYLGLNGLFNNIISMLSVAELGIGSAIIYNLYKPIADNNVEEVKSLMQFYKKAYRVIALVIFIVGMIIFPFLGIIVKDTTVSFGEVRFIYFLFILDIIVSYLLTYKRSILYASQKNYMINIVHFGYLLILNIVQIIIIIYTKNYLLYLSFRIVMRFVENVVISFIANRLYPYLKDDDVQKLNKNKFDSIVKKVKGLLVHKVGTFLVAGTDNIIISTFLGIELVGLYSNYYLIINAINTIINQTFSSFKSSVGNLIVTTTKEQTYIVYKRLQFMNFCFAMFSSVGIFVIMDSFITVWLGNEYILSKGVLISLSVCNYVYITKLCVSNFKEAAGIFYEDRLIPIIESVVNISFSILFLKFFGLSGVFMGTICTYLITHFYTYPQIVYPKVFGKEKMQYFKDNVKYLLVAFLGAFLCYFVSNLFIINNILGQLVVNILIVLIVLITLILLFFGKSKEFTYYIGMLKKIIGKVNYKKCGKKEVVK